MSDLKLFSKQSPVIQLTDSDFSFNKLDPTSVIIKNKHVKGKDGYLMVYASWCPHCQMKKDMWEHLAQELNKNKENESENFVITAMDSDDPKCNATCRQLGISGIPRFFHLVNNSSKSNTFHLVDYDGAPTIESFLDKACSVSHYNRLCSTKLKSLRN